MHVAAHVDAYVFGHVLRVSEAWVHPMDAKVLKSITDFFAAQIATGEYPNLEQMIGGDDVLSVFSRLTRWMAEDARFEAGLTAMLDGVEVQMRRAAGTPRPTDPAPTAPVPAPPRKRGRAQRPRSPRRSRSGR